MKKGGWRNFLAEIWCMLAHGEHHACTKRSGDIEQYKCLKCGKRGLRWRGSIY